MDMNNLIDEFLFVVPEIKRDFEKQKEINLVDDEDGYYTIWGFGLMPCIIELFSEFDNNKDILEKVFHFFEVMANSEEEIKELLVNQKWYSAIFGGIKQLYVATSHNMTNCIIELVERYENTLPSLENEVLGLENKVKSHLGRMGFAW